MSHLSEFKELLDRLTSEQKSDLHLIMTIILDIPKANVELLMVELERQVYDE